jgi:DNA polymerase III delta prime subunit
VHREEFLWVEKHRPRRVADCVLPPRLKDTFQQFVDQKNVPNLILSGGPGVGKTTIARAMLEELNADYIVINGSMNGNIDTLRNEIMQFASTVSFTGGRKYVILDEADYLNANSTQPALRNFMEEFSKNCGFVLTCNFKNRIIEPLHSRCSVIEFKLEGSERADMAAQFFKRVCGILKQEQVEFDKQTVAELVSKHIPDWRRTLNELQRYSATGKIDAGILKNLGEESVKTLLGFLKNKKWDEMRKWVGENSDQDAISLMRKIYDQAHLYLKPNSVPTIVMHIAKYQYQHAFAADAEINLVALLTEIMVDGEFK